jgi:hypothetical protein
VGHKKHYIGKRTLIMKNYYLYCDDTINLDLPKIADGLNNICKNNSFSAGKSPVIIKDKSISHPSSYKKLDPSIKSETADNKQVIIVTNKRYDEDYFYLPYKNITILSFFGWEHLTRLPISNGVIFFIADFLATDVDDSFRHNINDNRPKPECIFDFGWNKAGVDIGMRSSMICPACIKRINRMKLTPEKLEILDDLKRILNDLGAASKWDTDIFEYWGSRQVGKDNNKKGASGKIRNQVFICYSHEDDEWLRRLKIHLKPFERQYHMEVWDDTRIKSGRDWKQEITQALEKTRVAVLLVSADFLASDFIVDAELPSLLASAEAGGTVIMPLILTPCAFKSLPNICRFQAVNNPDHSLIEISQGEQERYLLKVSTDILENLR